MLLHFLLRLCLRGGVRSEEGHLRINEDQGCVLVEGREASSVWVPDYAVDAEVLLADWNLAD